MEKQTIQPKHKMYFYIFAMVVLLIIGFLSGYWMGRTHERTVWLDIVTKKQTNR